MDGRWARTPASCFGPSSGRSTSSRRTSPSSRRRRRGLAAYIEKLGLQAHTILSVTVIAVNGIGGALLIVGMWTRLAGWLNAAVLLIGLLTVYVRQGTLLKGTLVDAAIGRAWAGYEYVALLAAATILLSVGGGGGGGGGGKK